MSSVRVRGPKPKPTKPFMVEGEEFADVCHSGSPQGPLIIDVMMNTLSVADAKRFIKWLEAAIKEVEYDRLSRKEAP